MTPEAAKALYRRRIGVGEIIYIRRYTGGGANPPMYQAPVRARVMGYDANELVGTIVQGDRKVIFLAEDLITQQFALPITANDKVVVRGKEMQIKSPDDSTRRLQGQLIAFVLQVRG